MMKRKEEMKKEMKKKMRKMLLAMLVLCLIVPVLLPARAEAAKVRVPGKIMQATENCVNENGKCIVLDPSADRMYVFKEKSGKWRLAKSFRCLVGDGLCTYRHYFLLRSRSTDRKKIKEGGRTYRYVINIDCYEEMYHGQIHSYAEVRGKVKKCRMDNLFGISVCRSNAKWIYEHCGDGTAVMMV